MYSMSYVVFSSRVCMFVPLYLYICLYLYLYLYLCICICICDVAAALEGGPGLCALLITLASGLLVLATLPLSLFFSIKVIFIIIIPGMKIMMICHHHHLMITIIIRCCKKNSGQSQVVQEYERAVIFRLGRLLSGSAKGPVLFFTSCSSNLANAKSFTNELNLFNV